MKHAVKHIGHFVETLEVPTKAQHAAEVRA
jgi:hypothetical protein